jgi:hypothetical protein
MDAKSKSIEKRYSLDTHSRIADQDIYRTNTKLICGFLNSPRPHLSYLKHMDPFNIISTSFFKILSNTILLSKTDVIFSNIILLSKTDVIFCYRFTRSSAHLVLQETNIWLREQAMKFLIVRNSPSSCPFVPFGPNVLLNSCSWTLSA